MAEADQQPDQAGQHVEVLRLTTFGVSSKERYLLPARRHQGGPALSRLGTTNLYNAIRGTAHTIRSAYARQDEAGLKVALVTQQRIALELARRLLAHEGVDELRITVDERDLSG